MFRLCLRRTGVKHFLIIDAKIMPNPRSRPKPAPYPGQWQRPRPAWQGSESGSDTQTINWLGLRFNPVQGPGPGPGRVRFPAPERPFKRWREVARPTDQWRTVCAAAGDAPVRRVSGRACGKVASWRAAPPALHKQLILKAFRLAPCLPTCPSRWQARPPCRPSGASDSRPLDSPGWPCLPAGRMGIMDQADLEVPTADPPPKPTAAV
jgi:hypothetical protein